MLKSIVIFASLAASNPNEVVFKLSEANRLLDEGKEEQAELLIDSIHFYPYQPLKKFHEILQARTALRSHSPEKAVALLKASHNQDVRWKEGAKHAEAWSWILQGQNENALELLQDVGSSPELHLLKAKLYLALEKPEEGLLALQNLSLANDEDLSEVLLVKALLLREKGKSDEAIEVLQVSENEPHKGLYGDYILLILGKLYFEQNRYREAQIQWDLLLQKFPRSPFRPDALYWIARAQENEHVDPSELTRLHRDIALKYPDFAYGDEVYFNQYSFKDYLQGDKDAVLHLDRFATLYPSSPLKIVAYYLIGLDKEQERRTAEGKSIRKKNIKEAIHSFELAQESFDATPEPLEDYYRQVRNLAALERGKLYILVSQDSNGPKKDIHLHYAVDVLKPLINEDKEISTQAVLLLAGIYKSLGELEDAKMLVSRELEKLSGDSGAFVASLNTIQGEIYQQQQDYETAWHHFVKAEEAGEGRFLSHDQELDLWIRQALCYQQMEQYDQAMLLFSKTINRNVVSSQRVRAMYLRAEVYRKQGREELAKKQWEAVALKGGEWGQLARKKLEQED